MASISIESPVVVKGPSLESDSSEFVEFTRRIPKDEFSLIEKELAGLKSFQVNQFVYLMRSPDLFTSGGLLFKDKSAPYLALQALREQKLTIGEVATICRLHAALQHPGATLHSVDEDPDAFFEMLKTAESHAYKAFDMHEKPYVLGQDKIMLLMSALEEVSLVDHFYVRIAKEKKSPLPTIVDRICELGTIILLRDKQDRRIAASFGMMLIATALLTPEGCTPCPPSPVLGLSSLDDIRLGQEHDNSRRDMAIPFPGLSYPKEADGYYADNIDFTSHDFYHALQASQVPLGERRIFMDISRKLQELKYSEEIYSFFADLDMGIYRHLGMEPKAHFWRECTDFIISFAPDGADMIQWIQDIASAVPKELEENIGDAEKSIECEVETFCAAGRGDYPEVALLHEEVRMLAAVKALKLKNYDEHLKLNRL